MAAVLRSRPVSWGTTVGQPPEEVTSWIDVPDVTWVPTAGTVPCTRPAATVFEHFVEGTGFTERPWEVNVAVAVIVESPDTVGTGNLPPGGR